MVPPLILAFLFGALGACQSASVDALSPETPSDSAARANDRVRVSLSANGTQDHHFFKESP